MDHERLENAKNGYTLDEKGNKFYFTNPGIPGLHIYDNVWPNSMDFFNNLLNKEFWDSHEGDNNYRKWVREDFFDDVNFTRENGKQADTCWIYTHPEANKAIWPVLKSYCFHWNLDPKSRESLRITRFSNGEFFGAHSDDTFATPRTVSMVYYPNDDYEGGELEFIHFGIKIKPKAGQLFVFPSAYPYEHQIHEITGGNPRWTVVSFLFYGRDEESKLRRKGLPFPYKPVFTDEFANLFQM